MNRFLYLTVFAIIGVMLGGAVPHWVGDSWYAQYLALTFCIYLTPVIILWKFNKWLSLFIFYLVLSTYFVTFNSPRAMVLLVQVEALSLVSYGISLFSHAQRKVICKVFLGVLIFQSAWVLVQLFNLDFIFRSLKDPTKCLPVGFMGNPDQLGAIQAILSPLALMFSPMLLILSFLIICISKSFFAMVAFIGSLIVYHISRKLRSLFLILIGVGLLLGFYCKYVDEVNMRHVSIRTTAWNYSMESLVKGELNLKGKVVKCNPIFGYGFGNYSIIFPYLSQRGEVNTHAQKFTHAHNDYVEGLFELGYLGILLFVLVLLNFLKGFIRCFKSKELVIYFCCLVAYLIEASGNFVSHIAVSGVYLMILYGMYEGARRELNGKVSKLV